MPGVEDAVSGTLQLVAQEHSYQPPVDELGFCQIESHSVGGVVTEPACI
ncbi:hypothetical protein [Streptomyces sp. NPDC056628]